MKFESYFSSSKSNFYVVTAANGRQLLIECGCTWNQLIKALDYKLENVVGCLLSHEHKDHSHCVEKVMENGIDVYSSFNTFVELFIENRRAKEIMGKEGFFVGDTFDVFPFDVNHDATEPLGFVVTDRSSSKPWEHLLFVTDTSHIVQRFALQFNIIALCCNYDGEKLHALEEAGEINTELAKRLLTSHMEWHETMRYIREFCKRDKCTEIHLLHMSRSNIDAEKVRSKFEKEFFVRTLIAGNGGKSRRLDFLPDRQGRG